MIELHVAIVLHDAMSRRGVSRSPARQGRSMVMAALNA